MSGPARSESARHWRYDELPGLELLSARYVRHAFPRHSHDSFLLGSVISGVERMRVWEGVVDAGPGEVILFNPEVPHSARSGTPDGWAYVALYPSADLVREIAREVSTVRGTPGFREVLVDDPGTAALIPGVYQAAEAGNALAADSLLRVAVARLLGSHGGSLASSRTPRASGARTAALARALLEERMTEPPSLEGLALELGTSPFALLRAFKAQYGMPPHTWLTDARVRRARGLLDSGTAPSDVAVAVGFSDQPHLNRHFTRIVGVPPGAYRKERAGARS
ncbi:AraC family transcriptional regulator [Streptomyces sp. NPDC004609]|uniref:AraC family transcriptional regulator n=1 Tax=Streptomyces sp. NPDC004609 TaxID=3364704 RepID=UPI00368BB6BA